MRIRARLLTKNYELEERRMKLGLTQKDFAEIIGITIVRYQQIERMKIKPKEEEAENIALELDITKDILFPNGYEKIVNVFSKKQEFISDYVPPLLDNENDYLRLEEKIDAELTVKKLLKDSNLPLKELEIIKYRNGFVDNVPHTLEETGKKFGVTRERIRQMEAKSHERIRYSIKNHKYE